MTYLSSPKSFLLLLLAGALISGCKPGPTEPVEPKDEPVASNMPVEEPAEPSPTPRPSEPPLFPESLAFSAEFNGNTRAKTGGGVINGMLEGTAEYQPGRFGEALVVGDGGAIVSFPVKEVLLPEKGSIELWFKPLGWDLSHKAFHILFETNGKDNFLIYKFSTFMRFLVDAKEKTADAMFATHEGPLAADNFHHLVVTWSDGIGQIYLDGKPSPAMPIKQTPDLGSRFRLGDFGFTPRPAELQAKTLLDEARIYNRALTPAEILRLYHHNRTYDFSPVPELAVGPSKLSAQGGIDWLSAATITGFVLEGAADGTTKPGVLAPPDIQPKAAVSWDDSRLYFRLVQTVGNGKFLQAAIKQRDGDVGSDDAFEITLVPPGQQTRYRLQTNSAGVIADSRQNSGGPVDKAWNGKWEVKSVLEEGVWTLDVSIPFASLEAKPPAADESARWNAGFSRTNYIAPGQTQRTSWPGTRLGLLVLGKNLTVWGLDLIEVANGAYSAKAFVVPNEQNLPLASFLTIGSGDSAFVEQKTPIKDAKAGTRLDFTLKGDLPGGADRVTILGMGDDQTEARFSVPFERINATKFTFTPRPSLGVGVAELELDPGIPWERVRIRLLSGESSIQEVSEENKGTNSVSAKIPIGELPVGNYRVEVSSKSGEDWKVIGEAAFTKPDTSWMHNTIGVTAPTDQPPPPWTPITISQTPDSLTVSCWGRELTFDGKSPLPVQMTSQGTPLLASPVELKAGEEAIVWTTRRVVTNGPSQVILEADGLIGDRPTKARTIIEFDGLIYIEIEPADSSVPWAPLPDFSLEVPMRREVAPFMQLPSFDYLDSRVLSNEPGAQTSLPFAHYLWFGNDNTGLTWFTESRRGWTTAQERQMELENRGDARVLKVRIADGKKASPGKLAFGLQPTPTRERPKGWRGIGPVDLGTFAFLWASKAYTAHHGYPEAPDNKGPLIQLRDKLHGEGKLVVPYLHSSMLSEASPEYSYFGREWENTGKFFPRPDGQKDPIIEMRPSSNGWNDFAVWKIHRFVSEHQLDGVYHDFAAPTISSNPFGTANGDMPIMAWRDLYKRIYTSLKRLPRPTLYIQHVSVNSGGLCSPLLSFSDMVADNEQLAAILETKPPEFFFTGVPESYWRIRGSAKQYGPAPLNISSNNNFTPGYVGLLLLYDIHSSWSWFKDKTEAAKAVLRKTHQAMRDFGIGADDVSYIPPWNNTLVASSSPAVRVAAYRRGNRAMIVLVNSSTKPGAPVDVTFKSGLISATDAFTKTPIKAAGSDVLSIEVPPLDFRLLVVELKP